MSDGIPLCEKCARYENCAFSDTKAIECLIYMPRQYEYKSDFSIHEVSEYEDGKLNPLYGMEKYYLTDADIEALKDGKILYTTINCYEYAIVIGLKSEIDKHIKEDSNE